MWLGTQFGLSRFDGNTFTNYNTLNSPFLPSNGINKLLVDSDGYLWVGTKKGIVVLDPQTLSSQEFVVKGPVRDVIEDSQGNIWIAANGLFFVPRKQINLNNADKQYSESVNAIAVTQIAGSVSQLALSPQGIWLVNDRQLLRLTNSSSDYGKLRLELTAKVALPDRVAPHILGHFRKRIDRAPWQYINVQH